MNIEVSNTELYEFSEFLRGAEALNRKVALDEFIPLPHLHHEEQVELIKEIHEHRNERYWQIEGERGHGWCCGYCGTVVQWG